MRAGYIKVEWRKTLVKSTIILLIFSLFLEITDVVNYLIFVAVWYGFVGIYTFWKTSFKYNIGQKEIEICGLLTRKRISYSSIKDLFVSQGFLAKRFHCGSIYIVTKNGVNIIRDVKEPERIYTEIANIINRNNKSIE
ncbi:hypothetical protein HS7_05510 [Sulfolobales archaeon HS-7]|nr:hypothetical protein HS7_05510 [Sulfolobales archaeon HS-7]